MYSEATLEKRRAYCREYYQSHKEEEKTRALIYRQTNKEKLSVSWKKYRQVNKEKRAIYNKEYQQTHKKEIAESVKAYRQIHKEEIAIWEKAYQQTVKGKAVMRNKNHKRRALKMSVGYENFNSIEIFERDDYRCQICGKKTRPDLKNINHLFYPNLDHIISLSKGGTHTRQNTQCLCHQCNIIKSNNDSNAQLRLY